MNIEFKISKTPIKYKKALMFLEKRVNLVKLGGKELVWLLEHPTTYSAGIRSKEEEILDKSIKVTKTNRGGKITLHNPGQQIVYFVLNLNKRRRDIRNLIRQIENMIIKFLKIYKVKSNSDKNNIGIWVKNKKIAAIGVRVSRWVAYHGFSINIKNNLNDYKKIIPCGLENHEVTSLKNENKIANNVRKNLEMIIKENLSKI
ncbi:MAG: lipoyl(octanoyl) transferase [Candidatus Pelagibacter sp. TMED196]|nr:MAG: lipoyl(octanoyl) transferase [Candidatus Pelagibacter sp. TMED196]|tara:strand:+ start:3386 stop:3991 length:606 start_codon:yes stop_codon:yes gene_type:complete